MTLREVLLDELAAKRRARRLDVEPPQKHGRQTRTR
jgi:hypothetical protein